MPLLSELALGSLLIYPTRGRSAASRQAQEWVRYGIKLGKPDVIAHSVTRLRQGLAGSPIEELLAEPGVLVPVPRSAPLVKGGLWVPQRIGNELIKRQLAESLVPALERARPVRRSSGVTDASLRPTPAMHYDSMRVTDRFAAFERITLVDDVVTRGATLLACASLLADTFPGIEVRAFALARTDNRVDLEDSSQMLAPALGRVRFNEKTGHLVHEVIEAG